MPNTREDAARLRAHVDAAALEKALRECVSGEVRFDAGSRALYATDASNYRQVPIGVVIPRTVDDVVATVAQCRRHGAPILSRGAGTSLCGQCCNVAVVIDFSKYLNRIVEIDGARKLARVEPGVVLDELRDEAARKGLTFAPDPATHTHNTLGGMLGNNSCGPHSVMGGRTEENVLELDVLTYDGLRLRVGPTEEAEYAQILAEGGRRADIYRRLKELGQRYDAAVRRCYPDIPRRVSGYNLRAVLPGSTFDVARALVGSEGTCVLVLGATLRLVDNPPERVLLVLGYPDVFAAADAVPRVMRAGPIALEGMDDRLVHDMHAMDLAPGNVDLLPDGGGWLLVEFGGATREEAERKAQDLVDALGAEPEPRPSARLVIDPEAARRVWTIRESGLGATAHVPDMPLTWEGWEDSAVPPEQLGPYLRALRELLDRYGYRGDFYGHFGQGCLHTRIDFDLETAEGIERYRRFIHEAARLVSSMGGSISGEHGDGQSKAELLPIMFGDEVVQALREFKAIWDPDNRMNPGKVVDAWRVDENLRLGTRYDAHRVETFFAYPADNDDFARTMLRCVGVGKCRSRQGVMCPSYMATGEEMHSTRGRAHLLFEMLRGETVTGGWRDDAVKEALDLCLSCKGCKGECPVRVDMATYKAEFMWHYHAHRMRPMAAYAFGLIDRWARLAAHAPGLVNFMSAHQPFSGLARRVIGIAPERRLPAFARETFARRFRRRPRRAAGRALILWPDTFNNHLHPDVAEAAADVLEQAGFEVRIPAVPLCCGRPLYEFGMLERARRYLERILEALDEEIRVGVPLVVLEPACLTVFREELLQLLPGNEQAKRLAGQAFLLSEFLERKAPDAVLGTLPRKAVVHGHCHHQSVIGMEDERAVMKRLGLDFEILDSGCCGMAGAFGFEQEKYAVSMRCAERVLLPAVRNAAADTLLIADGYSCREQVAQATGRRPLHLSQVLHMAMTGAPPRPEPGGRRG